MEEEEEDAPGAELFMAFVSRISRSDRICQVRSANEYCPMGGSNKIMVRTKMGSTRK